MENLSTPIIKINKNGITQYFITFPQSGDLYREEFVDKLFPDKHVNDKIMCVQEHHKDGQLHLHLGCKLVHKITKPRLLAIITKLWPEDYKRIKIEKMANWQATVRYFKKEDKEPYLHNVILKKQEEEYYTPLMDMFNFEEELKMKEIDRQASIIIYREYINFVKMVTERTRKPENIPGHINNYLNGRNPPRKPEGYDE
jgi:hypothetical protein